MRHDVFDPMFAMMLQLWRGAVLEVARTNPEETVAGIETALAKVRKTAESMPEGEAHAVREICEAFVQDVKHYLGFEPSDTRDVMEIHVPIIDSKAKTV